MYKLLIIDDEPLVQVGIRSMLPWNELNIEVCGVAGNGKAGLEIIEKENPDIVITDIKMPVMSGLELLKQIRAQRNNLIPAFIVLTSYEDFQMAKEAISYSIVDYLIKLELTPANLKTAILKAIEICKSHSISSGQISMSQTEIQSLIDKFFIRLLHNLYDSEEQFDLLRTDLNIPFSYSAYQCCYFEMINENASALPVEKQINLFSNSFHLLKEITTKYQASYFVALDRKHGVIILLYDTIPCKDNSIRLKEKLELISNTLFGYYSTNLKCGIGSVVNVPLAISESYISARQAITNCSENLSIFAIDEVSDSDPNHTIFNMSIFKNDLNTAFSEYDSTILANVLNQITTLFQEYPTHYVQALDAACNVLFMSISFLPDGESVLSELFADISDGYRSIYKQKTTFQVITWLNLFKEKLCQYFSERKREHRHHVVENVKKYVETHLHDRLNLNEVSAIYGISPNYLSSLFKKYNDCGYSEYITYRKVEEAKRMMIESNKKIYEIANALGFESAFYFSKVFKKVEGISPSEYINK